MSEPRPMTKEEMVRDLLAHMAKMAKYWADVDLDTTSREMFTAEGKNEIQWRVEGLLFSFLVMLDGGTPLPAFDIAPCPHPSDEAFCRGAGHNWWVGGIVINDDIQLHEFLNSSACAKNILSETQDALDKSERRLKTACLALGTLRSVLGADDGDDRRPGSNFRSIVDAARKLKESVKESPRYVIVSEDGGTYAVAERQRDFNHEWYELVCGDLAMREAREKCAELDKEGR